MLKIKLQFKNATEPSMYNIDNWRLDGKVLLMYRRKTTILVNLDETTGDVVITEN